MNTAKTIAHLSAQATIGQIVSVSDSAESLLLSIGLKPENYYDKTLQQVCAELKWNEEEVLDWIKQKRTDYDEISQNGTEFQDSNDNSSLAKICDHIYLAYHDTIFTLIDDINESLPRVIKIHGIQDHSLKILEQEFDSFSGRLKESLKFQRNRFFRQIRKFEAEKNEVTDGVFQGIKKAILIIREDQDVLNKSMVNLDKITRHFFLPEYACSTFRIMMKSLETLVKEVKKLNQDIEEQLSQPISEKLN